MTSDEYYELDEVWGVGDDVSHSPGSSSGVLS